LIGAENSYQRFEFGIEAWPGSILNLTYCLNNRFQDLMQISPQRAAGHFIAV